MSVDFGVVVRAQDVMESLRDILGSEPSDAWLASEEARRLEQIDVRERVYACLHDRPSHPNLLRRLLVHEVELRRSDPATDAFENLYWCALLLHQIGRVEDVLPMWRAKHTDFDTGVGFDIQFLVGAGVDETLAFLESAEDPDAARARAHLIACREGGDFDDLPSWLARRRAYFAS